MEIREQPDVRQLVQAFLLLQNEEEAWSFFRDIFTDKELVELGRRWRAARMLHDGASYVEIEKSTGLSSTTIARISKWLQEGSGGYKMMLERAGANTIEAEEKGSSPEQSETKPVSNPLQPPK